MAIAPVVIEFLARGTPQVQAAFKSIQDAAIRAERAQAAAAESASRARVASSQREARARIAENKKAHDQLDKWQKVEAQSTQKAARDAESIERAKTRTIQREHRFRIDSARQAHKQLEQWQRAEVREAERTAKEKQRILDREARAQALAARDQFMERRRVAGAIIGAGAQGVMAGARRVGSVAMGLAGTAAQLGGGFSIADSVEKQLGATRAAANVAASTRGQNVSTQDVLSAAKATSITYGIEAEEAVGGIAQFKDLTGDTQRAMQLLPEITKLATAFGGSIEDLAKNAGNIAMSAPTLSNADVMNLLRVQTAQGAVGAVELKDMAALGGRLTAGASLFGGDRAQNIATMGAIAQVARQRGGAASPAEAAMASQRFATDVQKHADDLEGMGIKVRDGKGGITDARSIMLQMLEKSGGDVTKLTQFGLGERGIRALTGFSSIYRDAGGGDAGKKAVIDEFAKYTDGVSDAEVNERANRRMKDADKQLEQAFIKLRQEAGEKLLPVFMEMIPALQKLIPQFINAAQIGIPAFTQLMTTVANFAEAHKGIIQSVAAHPVGALIAVEVTKSFAAAALPTLLRDLFAKSLGGISTPGAAATGGGGAAGGSSLLGALGAGAAAGVATYALAKPSVDAVLEGQTSGQYKTGQLIASLKNGSPAERAATLAQIETMQARYGGVRGALSQYAGVSMSGVGAVYSGITGDKNFGAEELSKATQAKEILDNKDIQELVQALKANTQAVAAGGATGGNSGSNGAARQTSIRDR